MRKRYEVLNGLPAYGPVYVPVSEDNEVFCSECYVVRFYPAGGPSWVGNFKPGNTSLSLVVDLPGPDLLAVVYGLGYLMRPDHEKPLATFGWSLKQAFLVQETKRAFADDCCVYLLEESGQVWQSERIALDGMRQVEVRGSVLSGLAWQGGEDWRRFSVNFDTKEITVGAGGSPSWLGLGPNQLLSRT